MKPTGDSMTATRPCASGILPAVGGLCALAVAMGAGRFAYTAFLPGMMETHGFGEDTAGIMAAWNYAGYLAGALAVRGEKPGPRRYALLVLSLFLSLATTAGMGLFASAAPWHVVRFLAGVASGVCFVLCSAIVLDTLAFLGRPALAGILYAGVGTGIAASGVLTLPLMHLGGPATAWAGLAALCLLPTAVAVFALRPAVNHAPLPTATTGGGNGKKHGYGILLTAYFLEGFGYIIGATFLVALVQTTTNSPEAASLSWVITGCAAAVSAPLWRLAAGDRYRPMLTLALTVQAAGVLLPIASDSVFAALGGGLLLGGTFMGITVLSLQYGVSLSGRPSAHTIAYMTAIYGVGQILGPIVAGLLAREQGFAYSFILSSCGLFLAAGLLLSARGHTNR